MAVGTQTAKAKAATSQGAVAANLAAGKGKAKPEPVTAIAIRISAKAMSKDVGPRVIVGLAKADQDIEQGTAIKRAGETAKASHMAELSMAIIKAAKADTSIDLTAAVLPTSDAAEKSVAIKAMSMLSDQINIAIGNKEVVTVETKTGPQPKVVYTSAVANYFLKPGESKDTPEGKAKETLRTNFAHSLKVATKAALHVIERGITAEMDKASGTLRISGPEVKKQFGLASVVLDEKQTVIPTDKKGKPGEPVKLGEKPSFAAIARKAEQAHGKVAAPRVTNNRTLQSMTSDQAIVTLCKALVDAIAAMKTKPLAATVEALDSVYSAIDQM